MSNHPGNVDDHYYNDEEPPEFHSVFPDHQAIDDAPTPNFGTSDHSEAAMWAAYPSSRPPPPQQAQPPQPARILGCSECIRKKRTGCNRNPAEGRRTCTACAESGAMCLPPAIRGRGGGRKPKTAPTPQQPKVKRYGQTACLRCNDKKLRCSIVAGGQPPCSNCTKVGLECMVPLPAPPLTGGAGPVNPSHQAHYAHTLAHRFFPAARRSGVLARVFA